MRKGKAIRPNQRPVYCGALMRNGETLQLELDTLAIVLTQSDIDPYHFGRHLWIAQTARLPQNPPPPAMTAPLDNWFQWLDRMEICGRICTLRDIAELSGRSYQTVKKAHADYEAEHGEIA